MSDSKITIQNIAGLVTLILGTHYFLSYRWFSGILKNYGLESLAIITMEDLTFPYAKLNISVIAFTSIGFLGIFWWHLVSTQDSNPPKSLKESIKLMNSFFIKLKSWKKIGIIVFVLVILVFVYFKVFNPIISLPNRELITTYLVILLVIPILYIFIPRKRNLIFGLQLFLMFAWANQFINTILIETNSNKSKNITKISFEYKQQVIESSDSLSFLYHGYKYLIMKDTFGNCILYPSTLVDKITYKYEKKTISHEE